MSSTPGWGQGWLVVVAAAAAAAAVVVCYFAGWGWGSEHETRKTIFEHKKHKPHFLREGGGAEICHDMHVLQR